MSLTIAQVQKSALPTGASTEATLAALSAKLPSTIGQKVMASSLAVVIASDQSAIPVTGPLTDTQLRATAVPVSGTVTATGPLTDTQLRASAVTVTGPLTDTQLRASAVAVSGPLTDTQLRASAVSVSLASVPSHAVTNAGTFAVQVSSSALPTGAATETTLAAMSGKLPATLGQKLMAASTSVCIASDQTAITISAGSLPLPSGASTEATLAALSAKFPGAPGQTTMAGSLSVTIASNQSAVAVSGPLTDTQLRATAVPVSGPLTDTQLRASAVPVSIAGTVTVSGTVSDAQLPATLGQKLMAGSTSITIASDQTTLPVSLASVPSHPVTNAGTFAVQISSSALPTGAATETTLAAISATLTAIDAGMPVSLGQKVMASSQAVVIASDQSTLPVSGPQTDAQLRAFCVTNWVSVAAAVNTALTATLPAPGAGLFHYIVSVRVTKLYAVVGVASAAGVTITSTNIPGNPSWLTEQAAGALGTIAKVVDEVPGLPIKSQTANTATTIICPAQTQTIWRINVTYYTGP